MAETSTAAPAKKANLDNPVNIRNRSAANALMFVIVAFSFAIGALVASLFSRSADGLNMTPFYWYFGVMSVELIAWALIYFWMSRDIQE